MLSFTETARERLLSVTEYMDRPALRIAVSPGPSPIAPQCDFTLVETDEAVEGETVVDSGDLRLLVQPLHVPQLEGRVVDWAGEGFVLRQPAFDIDELGGELAERVRRVIEARINPGVAAHGGKITLVGVREDVAYIEMSGGCQGCAMSKLTLRQGVERMIREGVPEIAGVQDVTDHAQGVNPFYQHEG